MPSFLLPLFIPPFLIPSIPSSPSGSRAEITAWQVATSVAVAMSIYAGKSIESRGSYGALPAASESAASESAAPNMEMRSHTEQIIITISV